MFILFVSFATFHVLTIFLFTLSNFFFFLPFPPKFKFCLISNAKKFKSMHSLKSTRLTIPRPTVLRLLNLFVSLAIFTFERCKKGRTRKEFSVSMIAVDDLRQKSDGKVSSRNRSFRNFNRHLFPIVAYCSFAQFDKI